MFTMENVEKAEEIKRAEKRRIWFSVLRDAQMRLFSSQSSEGKIMWDGKNRPPLQHRYCSVVRNVENFSMHSQQFMRLGSDCCSGWQVYNFIFERSVYDDDKLDVSLLLSILSRLFLLPKSTSSTFYCLINLSQSLRLNSIPSTFTSYLFMILQFFFSSSVNNLLNFSSPPVQIQFQSCHPLRPINPHSHKLIQLILYSELSFVWIIKLYEYLENDWIIAKVFSTIFTINYSKSFKTLLLSFLLVEINNENKFSKFLWFF